MRCKKYVETIILLHFLSLTILLFLSTAIIMVYLKRFVNIGGHSKHRGRT